LLSGFGDILPFTKARKPKAQRAFISFRANTTIYQPVARMKSLFLIVYYKKMNRADKQAVIKAVFLLTIIY
jgi:hypothetical protein